MTFARSSESPPIWLVIHSVNMIRAMSLAALTACCWSGQSGSTRAAANAVSQPGQNSRKRYHRP
jgi:hypothetical protein